EPVPEPALTPQKIAALPPDLVDQLNQAVTLGDIEAALQIIDVIRTHDANLAQELKTLTRNYRFDEIQEVLAVVSENSLG
ncbi:MAG: hypothetical protein K1Y36_23130, partial [Blastocatellia bacterium]|nr:hypothetical protein [Blastocatellia bacterium]